MLFKRLLAITLFIMLFLSYQTNSQEPAPVKPSPMERTILQRVDVLGTKLEMVLASVKITKDAPVESHIHLNPAIVLVVEGEYWVQLKDQPRKTLQAGESCTVPGNVVHQDGAISKEVKLTAAYVVKKGEPLAIPAK